jgi:predicted DNA-binding transcriptional regulator YafY
MSRAERLLELMQSLRLRRRPVAGQALAEELGVSLRTLYRDIEALKAQGARIEGEAGLGYVLKPGFTLPPLMFSLAEVEALALGARWVEGRADPASRRRRAAPWRRSPPSCRRNERRRSIGRPCSPARGRRGSGKAQACR